MAEEYGKISKATMTAIAEQARRLGKVSGELTPGQIEEVLAGVTDVIANHIVSNVDFTMESMLEDTTPPPPPKYSYNGVVLPEIPADVLAEYPYCWIRNDGTNSKYDLVFSDTPWYCSSGRYMYDSTSGKVPYYSINYSGYENATEWPYAGESSDAFGINSSRTVLWSNHDIPNGSATATEIYFEGSEPVLVG